MPEVPPLANVEDVNLWIDVFKEKVGKKDVMVFIDTWQRATCGLSQNEEREMQGAINSAEAIGRGVRGPVVVAFHSPKSNRDTIAGWEGQRNTSNALWFIEREPRGVKLTARKVRSAPGSSTLILEYVEYETGLRDDYFNFPLKHVVPSRLGGHKIATDGTVLKEENLGGVRAALAFVLYAIEAKRKDDTNANTQYSIPQAAERIVGHPGKPSFTKACLMDDCANSEWAFELMGTLTKAGLKFPMEHADMARLIAESLGSGGITLENGHRVFIERSNKIARIGVDVGGLTTP